jgi:signal peptidase II
VRRGWVLLVAVAPLIVALDQWTKHWAATTLPFQQPVSVIGDVLRFTYTRNSGVAFGLGSGVNFPYWLFSIFAAIAILWLFWRRHPEGWAPQLALSLILGGAIGNLIDRVMAGEVVDFIEVGVRGWHWPVFNLADSAVSVGVVLFALTWSRRRPDAPAEAGDSPARDEHGSDARALGAGEPGGGAGGSLPRDGADRPVA